MTLTRIQQVCRSGGSRSVAATTAAVTLKRGTCLHVSKKSSDGELPSSAPNSESVDRVAAKRRRDTYLQPVFLNMGLMSTKSMCALQFLVLRHMWASSAFSVINQPDGCFVAVGSDAVPQWYLDSCRHALQPGAGLPSWLAPHAANITDPEGDAGDMVGQETAQRNKVGKQTWDDVIAEDHLFHILDAYPLEQPPADDLVNSDYWTAFKHQWITYQAATGSVGCNVALQCEAPHPDADNDIHHDAPACVVETANRRLVLRVLRDIPAGEPLLIHRGRAWWAQRLLSQLFVAADDSHISSLRWVESLVAKLADGKSAPAAHFPMLRPCKSRTDGVWRLGHVSEQRVATSVAVTAFALRRSCQVPTFLQRVLREGYGWGSAEDHMTSNPWKEVHVKKVIGQLLLEELMSEFTPAVPPASINV